MCVCVCVCVCVRVCVHLCVCKYSVRVCCVCVIGYLTITKGFEFRGALAPHKFFNLKYLLVLGCVLRMEQTCECVCTTVCAR